jgi:hypothetical protein
MTYQNDPNRRISWNDRAGMTGGLMAIVAVIAVILAAGLFYGLARNDKPITTNNAPPISTPSTTGQGGGTNVPSGAQQNVPNPGTPPR